MNTRALLIASCLAGSLTFAPACGGGTSEPGGSCASDADCQNATRCDGVEVCQGGACRPGTPVDCSDQNACTIDACDPATGACSHLPDESRCDDGVACTVDTCTEPGTCAHQPDDARCDDGLACDGAETCSSADGCRSGTPVACDDGVACTVDTCAEPGTCAHQPDDARCDDGLACDGAETCSSADGCRSGTPVACDDGVPCTADACAEPSGTCTHAPDDLLCSDGQLCNGSEACDPSLGCVPGAPHVCPDDGMACTTEVCDPVPDACRSVPHSDLCPCGQTCDPAQGGCGSYCSVRTCQGKVSACGDCVDNDGDCRIDADDDQCLGPCDNTEDSFYPGILGAPVVCNSDCYFDGDTGSGNDDCHWSHKCDPLEAAASYPPEGSQCAYDPNATIAGTVATCSGAFAAQSATCMAYCGPVTPNGCDCFGCCAIPGAATAVWLGSESPAGTGSCSLATLADPALCKPCTQVSACLNTCEHCELCVGKTELPSDCGAQLCEGGLASCGLPGQAPCGSGTFCVTGCCQPTPQ